MSVKFLVGDTVRKIKGSQWYGKVVGTYSTELTPEGYAVESFSEKGSVQIYPAAALESAQAAQAPASDDARQIEDLPPDEQLAVLRRNRERLSAMGVVFQTEEDLQRIGNSPALPAPGALAGLVEKWRSRIGRDHEGERACAAELEEAIRHIGNAPALPAPGALAGLERAWRARATAMPNMYAGQEVDKCADELCELLSKWNTL
jgi:dihydrofolate reductase (trimethoprim resistance protein)